MADAPTGVVVMAYGSPERPSQVEAYYTDIRRGRPPTADQLDDLRRRYEAIGGVSPLAARTRAQVAGLQEELERRAPGRFLAALGQKHATPSIEDAVRSLADDGADALIGVVLAPHYSTLSVQQYLDRVASAAETAGIASVVGIPSWHDSPAWIAAQAERVRRAWARFADDPTTLVLFTAHSLPARILETGDPYDAQLEESATAIAAEAGIERWRVAWQSAGRTPEPWLGPDLLEELRSLASTGTTSVIVCPQGFTSDHLEVLYDVDIAAAVVAAEVGIRLERTASLNDDPALLTALADAVLATEV